jgi:peptidoglycan hydrolase-like protein with peptidoglycan-binding domain
MRYAFLTIVAALFLAAGSARAQDAWVQIEALPTLQQAEERARAWGAAFPDVSGFRLSSGWYGIALGPYPAPEAANRLFALRAERLIPADSFIADGGNFTARFWPAGTATLGAGQADPAPAAGSAPGDGQSVAAAPQAAVLPDETPAEARQSEAALSEEARKELQTALQWFGVYDGAIDGAFGRGTRASMAAWQETRGYEPTGILTAAQRVALTEAWRGELAALGLGRVVENRAGIEIEMPIRLVEFDDYAPPFVRYREKDGSGIEVLLISQQGSQATLDGLYDAMQTLEIVPLTGFRERQGSSFTLTGQNASLHSHTWARLEDGMIKGFTLVYRPQDAARMARVIEIMRETLTSIGPALDPTIGATEATASRDLLSGLEVRRPARMRSGLYVDGQGAVLTVAEAVEGCARITLDDRYEATVAATDPASGLALLRPAVPLAPPGVAVLAAASPGIGAKAAVAGYPFGPALPAATLTFGSVEDLRGLDGEAGVLRLQAETEPGEAGGPVLDPAGRVAGVLLPDAAGGARQLPPGVRFAASAEVAADFLAAQGISAAPAAAMGGAPAPEDLTEAAMGMTVLVSCWN